jgi:predicted HicB family RNase H-like nuclease
MKRVIEGKSYNTDTAAIVARWSYTDSDDYDTEATLYITKGGAFFAVHEWGVPRADGLGNDAKVYFEAMSRQEVDRLMERSTSDIEIIDERYLAEPPEAVAEDEPGATVAVRMPVALKARVDEAADAAKLSTNAWAMRCFERCLSAS